MRHMMQHLGRLCSIGRILARQDALFVFEQIRPLRWLALLLWPFRVKHPSLRPGQRLANALEKLGPASIKLGQMLSTRGDLVGDDVAQDLANLRDKLPAFPAIQARAAVEAEFSQPLDALFAAFDETPVAAASIAQVHRARLHNGREVAVKILRPGVHEAFARDVELFDWIAHLMEKYMPAARRLKPKRVVQWLRETVEYELDLRFEAAAAQELADHIRPEDKFSVPRIEWSLTGQRVMVMQWVEGTPLSDIAALRAQGIDINQLLERIAAAFFNQVFRDGFFHGDLHPGNLFVGADGTLIAVDFGLMGRVNWRERLYLADMLHGFLTQDFTRVAAAHFDAGYVPPHKDMQQFAQACMAIAKPLLDRPLHEVSVGKLLEQLFRITELFEMETQPQLLMLQKAMILIEGIGRMLNPNVNMWELARPLIESSAQEQFSFLGRARHTAQELGQHAKKLPDILRQAILLLEEMALKKSA